jgi:hypothetical protein
LSLSRINIPGVFSFGYSSTLLHNILLYYYKMGSDPF